MNFVGVKVKPKSLTRPLVKTAAYLGIIQGVIWTSLSATCLVYYHTENLEATNEDLGAWIYYIYLNSNNSASIKSLNIIIGPPQFSYFMYIYLVLSVGWLIVSSVTLWAIYKDKKEKHYDGVIISWVVTAAVSSLLDLILLFILSYDYHTASDLKEISALSLAAVGVVMTFAVRGFVLWIVNVVFIVILTKHVRRRYKKSQSRKPQRNRSFIDAYAGPAKVPWQSGSSIYDDTGFDNRGFRGDQDPYAFPPRHYDNEDDRSSRYNNPKSPQYGNDYFPPVTPKTPQSRAQPVRDERNNNGNLPTPYRHNEPVNTYPQQRTAKIGPASGQRSPPLRVNPPNLPHIPDPDYSPPGSPKVRGVLRPNSNYMY